MIIAGDVGGTKTYLAAFDPAAQGFDPLVEQRYQTASYPSAGALLKAFADETQIAPNRTVLGVPGPVPPASRPRRQPALAHRPQRNFGRAQRH